MSKRKNLTIFSILFALLLIATALFLRYYLFNREGGEEKVAYAKLLEYCTEENSNLVVCPVFLREYEEEGDTACLHIILPEVDVEKRDITVCFDSDMQWDNPYGGYSLPVPVLLNMHYEDFAKKDEEPERIEIELMGQDLLTDLLTEINLSDSQRIIQVMTESAHRSIIKGYEYYGIRDWESGETYLALQLRNVRIESLERIENEIMMEISFRMDDDEFNYSFNTDEIDYVISEIGQGFILNVDSDLEDYFNPDIDYIFSFTFIDNRTDSLILYLTDEVVTDEIDGRIRGYFKGDEDSELLLKLENIVE